jgi:hypothetical protein
VKTWGVYLCQWRVSLIDLDFDALSASLILVFRIILEGKMTGKKEEPFSLIFYTDLNGFKMMTQIFSGDLG